MHIAGGVDVELPTLRFEVGSVREAGAPQGAIPRLPEHADSLHPDVVVVDQLLLLLRRQRGLQVLALLRLELRPRPVDPLGFSHGIFLVTGGSPRDSRLSRCEVLSIRKMQLTSSDDANCLLDCAFFAILRRMTESGRRPRRRAPSTFKGRPNELGAVLADLRTAKGLSLRQVEEATDKAGYLLPSGGKEGGRRARLAAFAIDDLTAEEEEELLKYLAFLRSRKPLS
jgi:hypothetical protein